MDARQGCSRVVAAVGCPKRAEGAKILSRAEITLPRRKRGASVGQVFRSYFGRAGVKTSRRCAGSGLGFGLGAFFASFLPLSLLPMAASVP